jgi:hypothetical protein
VSQNGRQFAIYLPHNQLGLAVPLKGVAYFYAPGMYATSQQDWETKINRDLAKFQEKGFNFVRIMVNADYSNEDNWMWWGCGTPPYKDSSVVTINRSPSLSVTARNSDHEWDKFLQIINAANNCGMIVEVAAQISSEDDPANPQNFDELKEVWEFVAGELQWKDNVIFDLSNEDNIGEHLSVQNVLDIKAVIPDHTSSGYKKRLCTMSYATAIDNENTPEDESNKLWDGDETNFRNYICSGGLDFITPHLSRDFNHQHPYGATTYYFDLTDSDCIGKHDARPVPVVYNEPFLIQTNTDSDYYNEDQWPNPAYFSSDPDPDGRSAEAFYKDYKCSLRSQPDDLYGAAGWLFMNEHFLQDMHQTDYYQLYDCMIAAERLVLYNVTTNNLRVTCN